MTCLVLGKVSGGRGIDTEASGGAESALRISPESVCACVCTLMWRSDVSLGVFLSHSPR